eukprot:Nitzschia sp. Nitz4//scaffold23_size168460//11093//12308//NITZ4_002201-RA/size168460-snap-gene-0.150-mRNA-1//-1//CDS//3329543581//322//frame0
MSSTQKEPSKTGNLDLGLVGAGLMQWGTTSIDNKVVNPKGNLSDTGVRDVWTACRDRGITFFDTAEGYGGGTSEVRIREVKSWYEKTHLEGKSDNVVVATKFLPTLWRWTKWNFYRSLYGSLERLGVSCIDLYFIHTPVHPLPIEYFIQWACDAVDDGLIKHIGISNCNADLTRRAEAVAVKNGKHIEANQIMLNLLVWNSEKHQETVRVCQELKIQIIAYSPIGQGLLTDGLTEEKFAGIRAVKMTGVKYDALYSLRQELLRISREQDCTMAQVAMNWVRGHGAIPLVGCRTVKQAVDAAGCMDWRLAKEEVKLLDELSLGLSLFERPFYRRCLFVVFLSMLQIAYKTELAYNGILDFFRGGSSSKEHKD